MDEPEVDEPEDAVPDSATRSRDPAIPDDGAWVIGLVRGGRLGCGRGEQVSPQACFGWMAPT